MRDVGMSYNMTRMWLTVYGKLNEDKRLILIPCEDENCEDKFLPVVIPIWISDVSFGLN